MKDDERVLDAIQRLGPLSAYGFSIILNLPEKSGVRSAIDRLRKKGEPIWNDPTRGAFWWADDAEPGPAPYTRWKRTWQDNSGITGTTELERVRMIFDTSRERA
jgi:hypothetical protein